MTTVLVYVWNKETRKVRNMKIVVRVSEANEGGGHGQKRQLPQPIRLWQS